MASPSSESNLFSPLPRWKTPWSEFVLSYGTQAVVIGILVWIPVLHPEILESPKKDYHAIELVPTPVPVNHTPQRQLKPVLVAELDPPPAALRLPAPQPIRSSRSCWRSSSLPPRGRCSASAPASSPSASSLSIRT